MIQKIIAVPNILLDVDFIRKLEFKSKVKDFDVLYLRSEKTLSFVLICTDASFPSLPENVPVLLSLEERQSGGALFSPLIYNLKRISVGKIYKGIESSVVVHQLVPQ